MPEGDKRTAGQGGDITTAVPLSAPLRRLQTGSGEERRTILYSSIVAALIFAADLLTKHYFATRFFQGESRSVIPGLLNFTYVCNKGAAWSMFSNYTWALLVFGIAAGVLLIWKFRYFAEGCPERFYALTLVLAGIAGNSMDRMWRGEVVDFIHVHYENIWHYPIFNIADIAICCGIGILLFSGFLRKKPPKTEAE